MRELRVRWKVEGRFSTDIEAYAWRPEACKKPVKYSIVRTVDQLIAIVVLGKCTWGKKFAPLGFDNGFCLRISFNLKNI